MGWKLLASGEIGDSRRDVRPSAGGGGVECGGVAGEDDSASNACILDWSDADGIADGEADVNFRFGCLDMSSTNRELYAVAGNDPQRARDAVHTDTPADFCLIPIGTNEPSVSACSPST